MITQNLQGHKINRNFVLQSQHDYSSNIDIINKKVILGQIYDHLVLEISCYQFFFFWGGRHSFNLFIMPAYAIAIDGLIIIFCHHRPFDEIWKQRNYLGIV